MRFPFFRNRDSVKNGILISIRRTGDGFHPGLFKIYNIINDMAEVLNASQMQKLQEVFVNCLSENRAPDYLQIRNEEFLDMFLTAKHLEGCSDKTIRYYRCNIQRMLETVVIKEEWSERTLQEVRLLLRKDGD